MKQYTKLPIVKLPVDIQLTLYLIREELKSRKLFLTLHEVGIDDCYYQPHLDSLILNNVGLDDGSDETFNICQQILDKRSRKIEADNDSIMNQALKAYHELQDEVRKRKNE
jgi:hypothetical protein